MRGFPCPSGILASGHRARRVRDDRPQCWGHPEVGARRASWGSCSVFLASICPQPAVRGTGPCGGDFQAPSCYQLLLGLKILTNMGRAVCLLRECEERAWDPALPGEAGKWIRSSSLGFEQERKGRLGWGGWPGSPCPCLCTMHLPGSPLGAQMQGRTGTHGSSLTFLPDS